MYYTTLLAAFSLTAGVHAASYTLSDNYVGSDFLTAFQHQAIPDPTNGRVLVFLFTVTALAFMKSIICRNYVDQATALSLNLTYASGDTLIMRADDTTVLSPSGPGRNSVRIQSNKAYTTHVAVFDVRHMPQGCSTWPAAWETDGNDWPNGGEVDIVRPSIMLLPLIEGINDQTPNTMTLHTGAVCSMPATRTMTGTPTGNDCDVNTDGNSGCGVQAPVADSYGPPFNAISGGWYAMERTETFIQVFFWPRNAGNVPSDVSSGSNNIDTDNWGEPTALFPNTSCDIADDFDANNIIINLTFCGDWAGIDSLFNAAGCPGDCVDFVNNNPSAFSEAYWDIAAVRVYE
ncbi:hypothetical protein NM688_g3716 [Phlebia brevispora]|uniref:Uncharacterized protein n=1 Tax=Phlebia brevispora TaxID=194682 RepID=A0ACC1T557_9APHY|nr:hypothetical protein NM688_g3716 [Phlebia brevispora]